MPPFDRIDITKVVGTLSDIQNITTIDQLNAQKAAFTQALTDLNTHINDQETQINALTANLNDKQAAFVDLQGQNSGLLQRVAAQQVDIDRLKARLAAVTTAPPVANPTILADSFRKVVDQIQSQARLQSVVGPATTIRKMDIEIKGLVTVQQDGSIGMVLPGLGTTVDSNQLSTLRASFAAIPGTGVSSPPAVTGIAPNSGPAAGGTQVTIAGTGFTGVGAVLFGGAPVASFTGVSDTQINAVSPPGSGTVDVTVITAAGGNSARNAADQFTYIAPPNVSALNPNSGPSTGGTLVTVTGTGFTGATGVTFGTVAGLRMQVVSDIQIKVLSPQASPGVVDVIVTGVGGNSNVSPADQFTYLPPPPVVTGINPNRGVLAGGATVTITGTAFAGVTAVTFGKIGSPTVNFVSDTQITAVSPKGAAVGTVDVIVTTPSGNSAPGTPGQFTYLQLIPVPAPTPVPPIQTPKGEKKASTRPKKAKGKT